MSRTSTIDKKTKSDFCIEEILGELILHTWTQLSKFQNLKYFYCNSLAAEVVLVLQDVVVLISQTLEISHQPALPCSLSSTVLFSHRLDTNKFSNLWFSPS